MVRVWNGEATLFTADPDGARRRRPGGSHQAGVAVTGKATLYNKHGFALGGLDNLRPHGFVAIRAEDRNVTERAKRQPADGLLPAARQCIPRIRGHHRHDLAVGQSSVEMPAPASG